LKKGTKTLPWLEALDKWIKAAKVGDDYYRKASKSTVKARKGFRHLTGAVFAGCQVNEVAVLNFMEWAKGRGAAVEGLYAPQVIKNGTIIEPGFLKVLSASGQIEFYAGGFPLADSVVTEVTKQFTIFINFCAQPFNGWCSPIPKNFKRFAQHIKPLRENMTLDQFEIITRWFFFYGLKHNVPVPGDATFAANFVLRAFGGPRKAEAGRSSGSDVSAGRLTLNDKDKIKVNARAIRMMSIFQFLHGFLKSWKTEASPKGHWEDRNTHLSEETEDCILYLAGFECNNKKVIDQAECFLKFCAEHRIAIPPRGQKDPDGGKDEFGFDEFVCWGPFPPNGFRHLALSMHYKVYFEDKVTAVWGGTSSGMLDDWYLSTFDMLGHRFTLEDVKRYWLSIPDLEFIPTFNTFRAKILAKGWGVKQANGITVGLPKGHKLDGEIDPELESIMEEIKAETGEVEINPHTIAILTKKLEDQKAKEAQLAERQNEWSVNNPTSKITDFAEYDALRQARKLLKNYREKLAAADKGLLFISKTTPRAGIANKKASISLTDRWPNFIDWLKSLPHDRAREFSKAINLGSDSIRGWVRYGRVPLQKTMEYVYARACEAEWGYISGVKYLPVRTEPTGVEVLQWKSFVAWARVQDRGFLKHFGMSLDLSADCLWNWIMRRKTQNTAPFIPSPDVIASVLLKASQMGWVYGAVVTPKYDQKRWDSLVAWIKLNNAKKRGFIMDLARTLQLHNSSVRNWLNGQRPLPERLQALETHSLSLGWKPNVKVEVITREQVMAAKVAQARLEADGNELEERALLEQLLKKYPDRARG
jgi:hypothetical protein